ncbi:DNA translocase FtsK [Streptococcus vestibularis]|uniref:DNA translocase FtsK n=1 Tax=Streptococcus vestibularis TaxID=1343 RepID=UPI00232BBF54|nr:DNA translocase FtsK [Streptococcus vestibularis]MDB6184821.1 DNA translocase FtsK [Streptococcus vestibularis]MDB6202108.1 DNA translocase FtsK [Streptococcus vestibularis]MDB6208233.1 DNA translocase FtsK [Streptococcus vestibularis]MDB6211640.1 DNA translocase FtsK [Streptococcus vestibularis]MDB6215965.1 DNA translocase FtsK [Streptococcus vestibularis]
MATTKKTKKRTASKNGKKRLTKAELDRQKAIKRMLWTFFFAFVLIFPVFRLGFFGVALYNIFRVFVGSMAYPLIFAIYVYLFGFKWLRKHSNYVTGFWMVFVGLLLEFHAYLFSLERMSGLDIFPGTKDLLFGELVSVQVARFAGGGMLGALLYQPISFLFSNIGSFMIGVLIILLGAFILSPWDVLDIMEYAKEAWQKGAEKRLERTAQRQEKKAERQAQKEREAEERAEAEHLADLTVDEETGEILDDAAEALPQEAEIFAPEPEIRDYASEDYYDNLPPEDYEDFQEDYAPYPEDVPTEEFPPSMVVEGDDAPVEVDFTPKELLQYKLPQIDLFAPDKPKSQSKEKNIVRKNIRILEDTFKSFNIDVKVERAEIGPSVTKYEVKPAVGVRVNRISNLADDLALALAAKDVRIEAPIPGKSLVGIEVPNSEIATVSFRELWEQSKTDPNKLLEVPLGKAVDGSARSFDLGRMPHLLVAGSTGSGKSVAVNGIISSILMKARPDQIKFLMVDPKMVELSVYNDIPHLLIPVVTNPRKAAKALQKVVDEMENRYELFSKFGVRNIAGYNAKVEDWNAQSQEKQIPLPLIVVIVDELADLMMVASKEVEDAIIRLGQKARAAGIHMILATQRPSVDVISGLIKANVPSRVAFAVSSGTDSRTILDENGAEKLLGRGDMLFKPIDENHPVRLQGSFISDDDVERIVTFIKDQASADYDESFDPGEVSENDFGGGSSTNGGSSEGDPLFEEAKALVLETQKASASMIQRRLSVGFNRATRLMEELEEAGVIGPAEGTKPRKVLMTQE